jgi:hypothetical protein
MHLLFTVKLTRYINKYSSILKTEVTCSSETSVDLKLTTRRYVPEDLTSLKELSLLNLIVRLREERSLIPETEIYAAL